ncbi:AAA-domain-containing protein [Metschnikowia bicuspidata var. bicuspidata NRRL YB-4993]|uniref:AAA-domain-containing protein n=1 Tax=Metschnikowia bicuspidata var. bicuspidata NRRL YB-4993 TaxID=869754 RepID=A0A1A0HCZ8_9ASCO|nr:AAA-domain-containing protein [Metschnikowia bicuspidata var. bicuspidata NRRL YB-4993]OBA21886.1 AAA-domain-containing protein [Metschnikowia bicuspidata var. bicuspidata NRRL YB-4993]
MPKSAAALSQAVDQKVYDLLHELLQEQTEQNRAGAPGLPELLLHIALARDLRALDVMLYVQSHDALLRRTKRAVLERSVDVVLRMCRQDEAEELAEVIRVQHEHAMQRAAELGADPEAELGADPEAESRLMDVVDSNDLNRLVVAMWGRSGSGRAGVNSHQTSHETPAHPEARKRARDAKAPGKTKKPKVEHCTPSTTLAALGGLQAVTTQLMELVGLPILHPEIYVATGVEPPRGILLYGPPGCGKTTIAHALAGELRVPFISVSAPSVVSGMSGESEKKLRDIFEEARALAPCIVFLDEIDAITPKRDGGAQREMERRIVAQLLTSMDELTLSNTGGKPVVVVGATNRPDALDSALRRAGRFDREILLNVPDEAQRCAILRTMTAGLKLQAGDAFNYWELAKMTPGFVGADLKSLVTAAGIAAIKRIFEGMSEEEAGARGGAAAMDVDTPPDVLHVFQRQPQQQQLSTIQRFLARHPGPLSAAQLAPLSITYQDFKTALPTVQPTAKREGFATVPDVTWKHVGALARVRMELHMCVVQPIKKPELYQKVGISAPAGVLMWGPPGCGKTLLAKAVANESRANFISVKGPELLNKYVGESERAVRQVFLRARALAPCIIFFDELDALVPRRTASLSESSARVVNTLLTELDGLNDRLGIFVVGATNRPDMIDPAMLRPGRLDKTLYIELPDADERLEILRTLTAANHTPLAPDVDLRAVAADARCRNFSGADLSLLVREAGVSALKKKFFFGQQVQELDDLGFYVDNASDDHIVVTAADFLAALSTITPSVSDKDRARYERLNLRLGWGVIHEDKKDGPDALQAL